MDLALPWGTPPTWMWHQGSGGTGGWAAPFVASQSPALGWPGLCRGKPGRASALRTLLPGQLPPLAAPLPSSALGGHLENGYILLHSQDVGAT